jgi:cytochrome c55X
VAGNDRDGVVTAPPGHASGILAGLLAVAVSMSSAVAGDAADRADRMYTDAAIANAWRVLRTVECARCHGRDYAGLAAPSIVLYAGTQSREIFVRMVLDGDPTRGMPGYRSNAYVAENIDDIYGYFLARANGDIGPDYRPTATTRGTIPCSASSPCPSTR